MFNVGGGEIIVIFLIALIVLGPDKLPGAARQAGKYLSEFRRMSSGFQQELRDAMDLNNLTSPTPTKPQSPGGPTAVVVDVTEVPAAETTDDAMPGTATTDPGEPSLAVGTDRAGMGSNGTGSDGTGQNGNGQHSTAQNGTGSNGASSNGARSNGAATEPNTQVAADATGAEVPAAANGPADPVRPPTTGSAAIPSAGPMIIDGPSGSFS